MSPQTRSAVTVWACLGTLLFCGAAQSAQDGFGCTIETIDKGKRLYVAAHRYNFGTLDPTLASPQQYALYYAPRNYNRAGISPPRFTFKSVKVGNDQGFNLFVASGGTSPDLYKPGWRFFPSMGAQMLYPPIGRGGWDELKDIEAEIPKYVLTRVKRLPDGDEVTIKAKQLGLELPPTDVQLTYNTAPGQRPLYGDPLDQHAIDPVARAAFERRAKAFLIRGCRNSAGKPISILD